MVLGCGSSDDEDTLCVVKGDNLGYNSDTTISEMPHSPKRAWDSDDDVDHTIEIDSDECHEICMHTVPLVGWRAAGSV
jgi:hypothetical protein